MELAKKKKKEQLGKLYLREWRLIRGYTQEKLAERLGTYRPSVSQWERGEVVPGEHYLSKLVRILKVGVVERLYENPFAEVE